MIAPLFLAVGLSAQPAPVRRVQYLMGTLCDVTAYGARADEAVTAAFAEIARLDRVLSLFKQESELSRLNGSHGDWFACSPALWEAIEASVRYADASGGAFDATILPVLRNGPQALASVGYQKLELDAQKHRARFRARDMGLDFGGIGKGIALDHAARILRQRGINAALLNFGGQVYALGSPPGAPAWPVRVGESTLLVRDASVSTSGNSEHPGHIASPFTGRRIMEDYEATVVARSATEADAWSTALFVLGPGSARRYDGCSIFSDKRREASAACSRYAGHD